MKAIAKLALVAGFVLVIAACGGGGSEPEGSTGQGEGTAITGQSAASSSDTTDTINTILSSSISSIEIFSQSTGSAKDTGSLKDSVMTNCKWYDANGNVLDTSDTNAIQTAFASTVRIECESACDPSGTMTSGFTNIDASPIFSGTPFANGIAMEAEFDSCVQQCTCSTNTLSGTVTLTMTGIYSDPCNAVVTMQSTGITINNSAPVTFNLTFNVTSASGDCSTIGDFNCDAMLSDNSTLFDGQTAYSKAQICDMMDANATCQ